MFPFAARAILAAINHVLQSSAWARERLAPHAGRTAELLADPLRLRFTVSPQGTLTESAADEPPAVTLTVPASALPQFLTGDADRAMSRLRIDGSADFADALGFVFRNLRWDLEEDLSRVLGDVLAHRVASGASALRDAQVRAFRSATGSVAEYLAEEQGLLATQAALSQHEDSLRTLRDDLARLDKRLDRLTARR